MKKAAYFCAKLLQPGSPMAKLKISLLGAGFMGKKHLEVINRHPNFDLVAVIDGDFSRNSASDFKVYEDFEVFLEGDKDTEILLIATPNYLHYSQGKKALQHGYNIILEKPVCLSSSEARDLQEIAKELNLNIFSIMQNHFSGISLWLREILDSGLLGEIYMAQTQCFWNRDERYYQPASWKGRKDQDGGTLFTQFYHFLNLNQSLFGDYKVVKPLLRTFRHANLIDFEDTAFLLCEFENGMIGNMNFTTAVYGQNTESSLTIVAENGTIKISGQYFNEVEYCHIKDYEFDDACFKATDNFENLHRNFTHIYETLLNGGNTAAEMEQNIKLLKIIEKIYGYSPTTIPT